MKNVVNHRLNALGFASGMNLPVILSILYFSSRGWYYTIFEYRRHKIDVKFSAESILTVRIYLYFDLQLKILDFVLMLDFATSPYFSGLF